MKTVTYPNIALEGRPLEVERLDRAAALGQTSNILRLITRAYSDQFEGEDKPLQPGTFKKRYSMPEAHTGFREKRIPSVYDAHGTYYGVYGESDAVGTRPLLASLKMLPGLKRPVKLRGKEYLGEILTDPDYQRQKLGSAMLHAHLVAQNQADITTKGMVLEAFDANPQINAWYKRLGFVFGSACQPLVVGGQQLEGHYMVSSQPSDNIRMILETRTPELAEYTIA